MVEAISDDLKKKPDSNAAVSTPAKANAKTSNKTFSGVRGQSDQNLIVQSDSSPAWILIRSGSNVYLEAAVDLQTISDKLIFSIDSSLKQYATTVKTNIKGSRTLHVKGDCNYSVNSSYTENIVGNHLLNVGSKQNTIAGAGQQIDIGGANTVTIKGGNITETVQGKKKSRVDANSSSIFNATAEEFIIGGVIKTKASTELSGTMGTKINITIAGEKTLTQGASEKVILGANAEMDLSAKCNLAFAPSFGTIVGASLKIFLIEEKTTAVNKCNAGNEKENVGLNSETSSVCANQGTELN